MDLDVQPRNNVQKVGIPQPPPYPDSNSSQFRVPIPYISQLHSQVYWLHMVKCGNK